MVDSQEVIAALGSLGHHRHQFGQGQPAQLPAHVGEIGEVGVGLAQRSVVEEALGQGEEDRLLGPAGRQVEGMRMGMAGRFRLPALASARPGDEPCCPLARMARISASAWSREGG